MTLSREIQRVIIYSGKCREMQETGMNMGKGVGENDWESRYW